MLEVYRKQIKDKHRNLNKKDSLGMVYLIVFYTGEKRWDGAKKLSELVDVPERFKSTFQDFEMNLIEINGESTYNFSNKDVKDLVNMTRCIYDQSIHTKEKLMEFNDSTKEVRKIVGKITETDWIVQNENKEEVEMCEAERAWEARVKNSGVEEGTASRTKQMYLKLIYKGKSIEEIADLFDTSVEEVQRALNYQA